jgi:hypothetical protein
MNRSEVKAIVERELEPLMRKLGIPHWKIRVVFDLRNGEDEFTTCGQCTRRVDYDQAFIEFDPDSLDDEQHVLKVLRHELFHVVLVPFDIVFNALRPVLDKDSTLAGAIDSIREHATEQAVINLERLWQGLTHDAVPPPESGDDAPAAIC